MLEEQKVITAQEMSRIEGLAYSDGMREQQFMENAACSVAERTIDFIQEHHLEKKVSLILGKGNNAGDAFAAGALLLEKGYAVSAWHFYALKSCSPLCQRMCKRFQDKGGIIHSVLDENAFRYNLEGVILDGLVGTGFKGKAEGILAFAIESANHTKLPIIAVDIPSGLNGNTGFVDSVAIHATQTIYLEFPKIGFFLHQGWDHIGQLVHGSFGLDEKYKAKANPVAFLFNTKNLSSLLPSIVRTRHKYQAGYVLSFAGSKNMPGAAILSSFSALVSGAGIVRLFHPRNMRIELCGAPYEIIKEEWDGKSLKRMKEESCRAKAILAGPGMGRTKAAELMIKTILKHISLPSVIDADALYFLAHNPKWTLPRQSVLTPHQGEMNMLLTSLTKKTTDPIQAYVDQKKATLVLKGAPTLIYHPHCLPLIISRGDPGMATAGSGDVLTGMIAAMLAQGLEPRTAACVAVALHAIAGEIAAQHLTSYCMTASDIMDFIPAAFFQVTL